MKRRFSSRELARRRKLRLKKFAAKVEKQSQKIGFIAHMAQQYNMTETRVKLFHTFTKDKQVTERLCRRIFLGHSFPEDLKELIDMVRRTQDPFGFSMSAQEVAAAMKILGKSGMAAALAGHRLRESLRALAKCTSQK